MTGTIKKSAVCWSLAVLMLLTACGGGASTLEGMVENSPEAKEAIEAQCKDGQTVEVNGNGLIYTYKFEQTFKGKDIKTVQKDIAKKNGKIKAEVPEDGGCSAGELRAGEGHREAGLYQRRRQRNLLRGNIK